MPATDLYLRLRLLAESAGQFLWLLFDASLFDGNIRI